MKNKSILTNPPTEDYNQAQTKEITTVLKSGEEILFFPSSLEILAGSTTPYTTTTVVGLLQQLPPLLQAMNHNTITNKYIKKITKEKRKSFALKYYYSSVSTSDLIDPILVASNVLVNQHSQPSIATVNSPIRATSKFPYKSKNSITRAPYSFLSFLPKNKFRNYKIMTRFV